MTDFESVQRWEAESDNDCPYMVHYKEGGYVSYEDYQDLLEAYKEIKWMYEGLCE